MIELTKTFNEIADNLETTELKDRANFACESMIKYFVKIGYMCIWNLEKARNIKYENTLILNKNYYEVFVPKFDETDEWNRYKFGKTVYLSKEETKKYDYKLFTKIITEFVEELITKTNLLDLKYDNHDLIENLIESINRVSSLVLYDGQSILTHHYRNYNRNLDLVSHFKCVSRIKKTLIYIVIYLNDFQYSFKIYENGIKFNYDLGNYIQDYLYKYIRDNSNSIKEELLFEKLSIQPLQYLYSLYDYSYSYKSFDSRTKILNAVEKLKEIVGILKAKIGVTMENIPSDFEYIYRSYEKLVFNTKINSFIENNLASLIMDYYDNYFNDGKDIRELDEYKESFTTLKEITDSIYYLKDGYLILKPLLIAKYSNINKNNKNEILKEIEAITEEIGLKLQIFSDLHSRVLKSECNFDIESDFRFDNHFADKINEIILLKEEERFNKKLECYKDSIGKLTEEEKKEYCIRFLNFLGKYNKFDPITIIDLDNETKLYNYSDNNWFKTSNDYWEFIRKNSILVNNLAMAEKLLEYSDYMLTEGDYTCYIVGQVKCVERIIKEILVQIFPRSIYKFDKRKFKDYLDYDKQAKKHIYPCNPIRFDESTINSLNADSLSDGGAKIFRGLNSNDFHSYELKFELGPCVYALSYALYLNDRNYKGIFKAEINNTGIDCRQTPFMVHFVNPKTEIRNKGLYNGTYLGIRNGYFHIDIVKDYEDALKKSRLTSYWMCRVIDEILHYFPNKKLR